MVRYAIIVAALIASAPAIAQEQLGWQTYEDPQLGFTIELPSALFSPIEGGEPGQLLLGEQGGEAELLIYGVAGPQQTDFDRFIADVESASGVDVISYRAEGDSWLVLSGYLEMGQRIFYAKFMFTPERDALSAFEITYPARDKERFDAIVARLEGSLTRPLQ